LALALGVSRYGISRARSGVLGRQADRHLTAAWNIAAKLPMWGALPLPPKAPYEPLRLEVKG